MFHHEVYKNSTNELENSKFLSSITFHPCIAKVLGEIETPDSSIFISEFCNVNINLIVVLFKSNKLNHVCFI